MQHYDPERMVMRAKLGPWLLGIWSMTGCRTWVGYGRTESPEGVPLWAGWIGSMTVIIARLPRGI